ncbi:DUF2145 domain-containing protein [Paraburkholderia haematera]|uniref:DUF2145 domain-containing protein n=1 Tax=Paraburkholderia haematera TaxID=2793077 RepID=A0ABN7L4N9_9BURK|nr:DUF2145 domain-containing protein [Paraburkholderia haematera]CAE6730695.1 hypothetical protein R69888_02046 [Paraburkholderia haematera]
MNLRRLLISVLAIAIVGPAHVSMAVAAQPALSTASNFCGRSQPFTAAQQDKLLRFAAVVRQEVAATDSGAVLISRSGLNLSRFGIRYSHAAVALRKESGTWMVRQLYYDCDEGRPRLYDQGLAGFVMGIDDVSHGYISIVQLPVGAGDALRNTALDTSRALQLLAATYSANAYPFSVRYQNCNQWVAELLALSWGNIDGGRELRERAQNWLREAKYTPQPVDVDSHLLMFAATFVPHVHLDDHPQEDIFAMQLKVSLPSTVETFVRDRQPDSERIEICYADKRIVVHRGWTPIADGCEPAEEDRVVSLD